MDTLEKNSKNKTNENPVDQYRRQVQMLLQTYAKASSTDPEIETQLLIDTQHDHYQLVDVGWRHDLRVYSSILHIDIKDDKVWLQQNMTDRLVAEELIEMGIPKEQIVIGFHPPYVRPHTGFAIT